ncbi:hypothetical protein ACI2OX_10730 [Bacillus sp. N9]
MSVVKQLSLHFQSAKYIGLFNEFLFVKKLLAEMEQFHNGKTSSFFKR